MIHSNSAAALASESESGRLSKREALILDALRQFTRWNGGMTDREILITLHMLDMNSVRPRVSELIKRGVLEEIGSMRDPLTGKRVRLVRLKQGQGNLF